MARPSTAAVRSLSGWKEPCRVATTANIDLSAGGLLTIDAVTVTSGMRVLVKDQTDATENGIYTAAEGEWYRSPDATSQRNINKYILVLVQAGTVNSGRIYAFDTLDPDIGEDDIDLALQDFGPTEGSWQPLDGDLTLISALTTTVFGRDLLTLNNLTELQDLLDLENLIISLIEQPLPLVLATAADVRSAATGDKLMTSELMASASAPVALTDAATVALDWDTGIAFTLAIAGDRTLGNPTNGQPGTWRHIVITQGASGSHTLAYDTQYKFAGGTEPVLSTAEGAIDMLAIFCISSTSFVVSSAIDLKV
jgi:hypothetical protein